MNSDENQIQLKNLEPIEIIHVNDDLWDPVKMGEWWRWRQPHTIDIVLI